jgi:hypothetical protein
VLQPDTETLSVVARLVDALLDADRRVREHLLPFNEDDDELEREVDAANDALVAALDQFGEYDREKDALALYINENYSFQATLDEITERGHHDVAERWRERVDGVAGHEQRVTVAPGLHVRFREWSGSARREVTVRYETYWSPNPASGAGRPDQSPLEVAAQNLLDQIPTPLSIRTTA